MCNTTLHQTCVALCPHAGSSAHPPEPVPVSSTAKLNSSILPGTVLPALSSLLQISNTSTCRSMVSPSRLPSSTRSFSQSSSPLRTRCPGPGCPTCVHAFEVRSSGDCNCCTASPFWGRDAFSSSGQHFSSGGSKPTPRCSTSISMSTSSCSGCTSSHPHTVFPSCSVSSGTATVTSGSIEETSSSSRCSSRSSSRSSSRRSSSSSFYSCTSTDLNTAFTSSRSYIDKQLAMPGPSLFTSRGYSSGLDVSSTGVVEQEAVSAEAVSGGGARSVTAGEALALSVDDGSDNSSSSSSADSTGDGPTTALQISAAR